MPIATSHLSTRQMTGAQFRSFQETRADHERWELVKGIPVMMGAAHNFASTDR
jgi:hypothetical protein